ncbi:NAD(P)-binding protein [Thozetella sp. PMI_491]|nr:NAD(P)-binding protein [Thozetella sp. PMI_491]
MSQSAIPKGSWVLVTGATGLIGSSVSSEILSAGYKVRAPIRNAEKGSFLTSLFEKKYGAGVFDTVLISNMAEPGALTEAMKDCAGVVHIMNNNCFSPDPNEVITKSLAFVNNILTAAASTPSVKRVVYTSSASVLPPVAKPGLVTSSSWDPDADDIVAKAWAEPHVPEKATLVYYASKISEERACWEFVQREKPGFVLNTVVAGLIVGDNLHPKLISSSNGAVLGLLQSHPRAVGFLAGISPTYFVNLKDAALLHLAALTMDHVADQRILALGEIFDYNHTLDVLGKLVPGSNLPAKVDGLAKPVAELDTAASVELLKKLSQDGFVGLDESITRCISTAATGTA